MQRDNSIILTDNIKNNIMETKNLKEAARLYAESQFEPENINDPTYRDSLEALMQDFEAGANWVSSHLRASFEQAEATAKEYAQRLTDQENTDDIETSFLEGVEWYQVEVSKKWNRKPIIVDGNEGYQIEINETWYQKCANFLFHQTFIGWFIIGMIFIILFLYIVL